MEYTFTLRYQLSPQDADHEPLIERLGAAGCDDALIGVGLPGRIALEFTRQAASAESALLSALADVKRAIPCARLVEAAPDFVGLTDVAELIGVSRQNVRKHMVNNTGSFPTPVHEGSASVWHLAEIIDWLHARGTCTVEPTLADVARVAMQINIGKGLHRLQPGVRRALRALAA